MLLLEQQKKINKGEKMKNKEQWFYAKLGKQKPKQFGLAMGNLYSKNFDKNKYLYSIHDNGVYKSFIKGSIGYELNHIRILDEKSNKEIININKKIQKLTEERNKIFSKAKTRPINEEEIRELER